MSSNREFGHVSTQLQSSMPTCEMEFTGSQVLELTLDILFEES